MVKDIDDQFLDVDFVRDEKYCAGDLGGTMFGLSSYEDKVQAMSDSEIAECIERIDSEHSGAEMLITRIYDQKREGSCVAQSCAQANQIIQAREVGKSEVVQLSAMSLYKRIGRSSSSGATVASGLKEMRTRGLLPLDNDENKSKYGDQVMPNTGFRNPYPSEWEKTAKQFRIAEYQIIRSIAGIWTALCKREPVIVGREGHSICYTTPIIHKGRRAAQYANSWSENWGFADAGFKGGFGADTESQVRKSASWAVAVRSLVRRKRWS